MGGISGQHILSIKINGQDLPNLRSAVVEVIINNVVLGVPSCKLVLNDMQGVFTGPLAIVDGTKITITRGKHIGSLRTSTFSAIGTRGGGSAGGNNTRIVIGLLDLPEFFYDSRPYVKQGTSLDVLADIAKRAGLEFATNIKSVDDSMRWMSFNASPRQFIETLEKRMFMPEGGYVQTFVTEDKRLIVDDLLARMDEEPIATFVFDYPPDAGSSAILLTEFKDKSVSGHYNANVGYGHRTLATNDEGKVESYSKGTVKAQGAVNVNASRRESIAGTNTVHESHMPVTKGASANVHRNWVKAYDNWKRQFALFSEYSRGMAQGTLYSLEPLRPVMIKVGSISGKGAKLREDVSGKWLYVGYTERIGSSGIFTAPLFNRNFVGTTGNTQLADGEAGKNAAITPTPSVADPVRPPQIDDNVRQAKDGMTALDSMVEKQSKAVEDLVAGFADNAAQAINLPELASKYGAAADKLNALMSEFSMATMANRLCSMLSPLEKLSLDFSLKDPGAILRMLDSRLGSIEDMMGMFASDINGLIANGDIPDTYRDLPTLNAPCAANKISEMTDAMEDKFGSKCLSALTLDKLHGPSLDLESLYAKYEQYMRKFLCAMGESTSADAEVI